MRVRAKWYTIKSCKMYDLQTNQYDEVRILMHGSVFATFRGQNAHSDCKRMWRTIETINK